MIYSLFQIFVFDPDLIVHYIFTPKNISQSQPKASCMIDYAKNNYNIHSSGVSLQQTKEERYTII